MSDINTNNNLKFNIFNLGDCTGITMQDTTTNKIISQYKLSGKEQILSFLELENEHFFNILSSPTNKTISFISFKNDNSKDYAGYKYTIVGNTIEDACDLLERCGAFLTKIGLSFKIATRMLIESSNPEQNKKLLTIYVNQRIDNDLLLDNLKYLLKGYRGYSGIILKYSQHINGAIYMRSDLDSNGNYIPASRKLENLIDITKSNQVLNLFLYDE